MRLAAVFLLSVSLQAADPFGRDTPQGAVLGFLRAAQHDQYRAAAQYLQVAERDLDTRGVRLAQQLRSVMDQGFTAGIDSISNKPDGALDDGLPLDTERAGRILIEEKSVELMLVRVGDPRSGQHWLISAQTLAQVPELYQMVGFPAFEEHLPERVVQTRFLSMPLWQWVATIVLACLLVALPAWIFRRWSLGAPAILIVGMIAHLAAVIALRVPLLYRYYYYRVVVITIIAGVGWLLWRVADRFARHAISSSWGKCSPIFRPVTVVQPLQDNCDVNLLAFIPE